MKVSIDIGFGDVIYPGRVRMEYPTLLGDNPPQLYAYSIYSVIAEKAEAVVSLGELNTRYKDFYDLCSISEREDLDGATLREALVETFANRHTDFGDIAAFHAGFAEDRIRQQQWRGFLRSKDVRGEKSLSDTVREVKDFLFPVVAAISNGDDFPYAWSHTSGKWLPPLSAAETIN